ncbi:MAG: flippase [Candidatus Magnetoovum sp. WYHC-5]|nr:flippase [Candidatus Magnetoovum sp. WYHC-5]
MKNKLSIVISNTAYTFIARLIEVFSSLAVIALLSRYLGVNDFGLYLLYMAFIMVSIPVIGLSFPRILARDIAQRNNMAAEYLGVGITWNLFMIVFILGGLKFFVDTDKVFLYLLLIVNVGFISLTQTLNALYTAFQRMVLETVPTIVTSVTTIVFVFLTVYYDLGLITIFVVMAVANFFGLLTTYILIFKKFSILAVPSFNFQLIRYFFKESVHLSVFHILTQVYLYVGVFVLQFMATQSDVALFQAPFRFFTRLIIIPMSLMVAMLPVFSVLFDKKAAKAELTLTVNATIKVLAVISMFFSIYGYFLSPYIISILLGEGFTDSVIVLKLMTAGIFFFFLNQFMECLFIASKRQGYLVIIQGVGLFVCMMLNVVFVNKFAYLGSAFAMFVSNMVIFIMSYYLFFDLLKAFVYKGLLIIVIGTLAGISTYIVSLWMNMFAALLVGSLCLVCGLYLSKVVVKEEIVMLLGLLKAKRLYKH